MAELIFVSGCGKTGTSSLTALINADPACFLLYEAYLCKQDAPSPRGQQFLEKFPHLNKAFQGVNSLTLSYQHLAELLKEDGSAFDFFGDKILADVFSEKHWSELGKHRVFFMVRDLRTWLCKNVVVKDYHEVGGLAVKAVRYVQKFLESFGWRNSLRISMESFIFDNPKEVSRVFTFLQKPVPNRARKWWNTVGKYSENLKMAVPWWQGHDSSRLRPHKLDTSSLLTDHHFWKEILPIFDKYYHGLDSTFSLKEITADLQFLDALAKRHENLVLSDLYEEAQSVSFGTGLLGSIGHRSSNPHTKPFSIKKR